MQNFSYENELDLHENEPVGGTHIFVLNDFTQTHFDTGCEEGNSEVAYCYKINLLAINTN